MTKLDQINGCTDHNFSNVTCKYVATCKIWQDWCDNFTDSYVNINLNTFQTVYSEHVGVYTNDGYCVFHPCNIKDYWRHP